MMRHREIAMQYFKNGYSCSQAVVLAFEDQLSVDRDTLLKISASFGGGMGRLREVCGAVTGMFIVIGCLYGYTNPNDIDNKMKHYERVQTLASMFRDKNRYIVCSELLGLKKQADIPLPDLRTAEFYKKRPCLELVGDAADVLDDYLAEAGFFEEREE